MKSCKRCVITGKVQGVFFRQGTYDKATELGLTGWVRNLDSGAVECLICGDTDKIDAMCEWLKDGPAAAKVEDVAMEESAWADYDKFIIER